MDLNTDERYILYTKIRNQYGIGNYSFEKKIKYQKRINTREHFEKMKTRDDTIALFENHCYINLMNPKNYIYVDEYIKLIPKYLKKTKNIINGDIDIYWKVFNKEDPLNYKKYPDFWHNGCFYIAMLYYGYEYKINRKGVVNWNGTLIKKND
jgi:hypothetical protein